MRFLISILMLALLSGCAAVSASFVASERQSFNAVKPLLLKESADHPEDAPAVTDFLQSWDEKLKAAEAVK